MTAQMSANMMQQMQMIGAMYDAKEQLEAQRDIQRLTAQAHKDYHPSEGMCEIGTMIRDLAATQTRSKLTKTTVSQRLLARELSSGDMPLTVEGPVSDTYSRIKDFRDKYCDVKDNGNGLDYFCNNKNAPPEKRNRDINYVATMETPLTLDINFLDETKTDDEETVLSLINYLFMHEPAPKMPKDLSGDRNFTRAYQDLRSIIAMRGVARNTISAVVAQKSVGPENEGKATPFIKSLLKQMGLSDQPAGGAKKSEIDLLVGENPSYFAQMEILTKKIYQDPTFIANLYDKPANVKRIRASMQAIKLMQDRDIHEALMRREMLLSMILETRLRAYQERLYNQVSGNLFSGVAAPGISVGPAPTPGDPNLPNLFGQ